MNVPDDGKEFARLLEEIIGKILPDALDRHAERRQQFEREAKHYSASDIALKTGTSLAQVLFWCREGMIIAKKRENIMSGAHEKWEIPHSEWVRYQDEGLYPRYSVDSFAKAIHKFDKEFDVATLRRMISDWCETGAIRARKCPHGWRIFPQELRKHLEPRGLWVRQKRPSGKRKSKG